MGSVMTAYFLSALLGNSHGQADRQLFLKATGSSTLQVRSSFQGLQLMWVGGWSLSLLHSGVDFAALSSKLKQARILSDDADSQQFLKVVPINRYCLEPGWFLLATSELSSSLLWFYLSRKYSDNTKCTELKNLI